MSAACRYMRHHPDFLEWLANGDPRGAELLRRFRADPQIAPWLRHQVAFKRHNMELTNLLDKADWFIHQSGQALMLTETYRQQRDRGQLDKLSPTRLAVHRAVFSLALYNGAPVLASLRYLRTAVSAQSRGQLVPNPSTISKHLHGLTAAGLIDYRPGKRGPYVDAGRIHLEVTPVYGVPDVDVELVLTLSLTAAQRLALSEYAENAAELRQKLLAEYRERQDKINLTIGLPELRRFMEDLFERSEREEEERRKRPTHTPDGLRILY